MSTKGYSLDLRERVIKFIEKGDSQVSAAKIFSLNLSTVNRWYLRYREEGHYAARKRLGSKSKIDQKALIRYISDNPYLKLKDIAQKFGLTLWGIYYWLKKLGFRYKKKALAIRNHAQKSDNFI